jgi:hypothetical protein
MYDGAKTQKMIKKPIIPSSTTPVI